MTPNRTQLLRSWNISHTASATGLTTYGPCFSPERLFFIHAVLGIAIACLVATHIGAALHHHFVRRDRVLLRMITG
jgi:cytochrome b561